VTLTTPPLGVNHHQFYCTRRSLSNKEKNEVSTFNRSKVTVFYVLDTCL